MSSVYKCQPNNERENSENESFLYALTKIAEKEGYVRHTIDKKKILSEGGNYFGVLYEINIEGETADKTKQKTNIFVKQVIPNSKNIKLVSLSEMYNKEFFIYTELAKVFTALEDKAKTPMKKRFKLVKMYNESNQNALIFENLTKQGFKTYSKIEIMSFNYAKLCVEHLAKFHALAFLIERNIPEFNENKIKPIKQSIVYDDNYKLLANKIFKLATKKLSYDLKCKVDKWWEVAFDDYVKYIKGIMTNVKCLCHGDFKTNNIMYKEIEGKVTEVIAVDYQLAHYGSPILDLIYFIFMGTDQKFREKHLSQLKDHYYTSLKKYLEYFDVLVDDIYPRKTFEKDFENAIDYGLVSCICVLPFVLTGEDENPDIFENGVVRIGKQFDDRYYDRIQDILNYYLK